MKALLIGDFCLDIYHYGICDRLSPEAPIPILNKKFEEIKPGMSGNVKENLVALGFEVTHIKSNPTRKHRFVDVKFNHQILRMDEDTLSKTESLNFLEIKSAGYDYDVIIISDYDKGFLSHSDCKKIVNHFKHLNIPIFVDSKKEDLSCFNNCFIKVNKKEFESITNAPIDSELIVTNGSGGAAHNGKVYPAKKTNVYDICGAGDVFLAALAYKYMVTKDLDISIPFANQCAGISVSHLGTYTLTQKDIENILIQKT